MGKLKAERERLNGHRRAPATALALESDWRHFERWARSVGRAPLPASSETVELYLTYCATDLGHRVSTLHRRVWAIGRTHQAAGQASPVGDRVRGLMAATARAKGTRSRAKAALTMEQLHRMVAGLDARTERGARDRAILLLGFSTGLRRSELAAWLSTRSKSTTGGV